MIIWEQKSYVVIVGRPQGVMPSRLHLPRSLYDFPYDFFFKSNVIMCYDVGVYNSYGHRSNSCSSFLRCPESELFGDRSEIKGSPHTLS